MFYHSLLHKFYQLPKKKKRFIKFYKTFINAGDLCFDIGSNIGERTEIFLALGAKVISVEPQPVCIKFQKQKFAKNKNVKWFEGGAANINGSMELMLCKKVNECSTFSDEFVKFYSTHFNFLKWEEKISVPVTTLDELIAEHGTPKYCKIDVEGYEAKVMEGLSSPIPFIEFEFNLPLIHIATQCVEKLGTPGNYEFNYIAFEEMKPKLIEWKSAKEMVEILKNLSPKILSGEILARING